MVFHDSNRKVRTGNDDGKDHGEDDGDVVDGDDVDNRDGNDGDGEGGIGAVMRVVMARAMTTTVNTVLLTSRIPTHQTCNISTRIHHSHRWIFS